MKIEWLSSQVAQVASAKQPHSFYLAEGAKILLVDLDETTLKKAVEELEGKNIKYSAAIFNDEKNKKQ